MVTSAGIDSTTACGEDCHLLAAGPRVEEALDGVMPKSPVIPAGKDAA